MFALVFRFPHGRYHATPWGRHVNEGAVAWPPEPYRLLRALIAVWHRKADQTRWDVAVLHQLIEALAESPPIYRLPDAVHAHTRHYMPQAKPGDTKLVFDAFYRVMPDAELVAAWPALTLDQEAFALAAHLAGLMGYLGRAESVVVAHATDMTDAGMCTVLPLEERSTQAPLGWSTTDVLATLPPADYAQARAANMGEAGKQSAKERSVLAATLPESLTQALQVETSQLQAAGWSRPPASRLLVYARPEVGPRPPAGGRRREPPGDGARHTVARLILAGRPRPLIIDAVRIGEVFRRALMARVDGPVPPILSGRDAAGEPLRDSGHAHAFFLPEDHDADGNIDHLVVYARDGLPRAIRCAVESLRTLWIASGRGRDPEEDGGSGRKEWRVALEGYGQPADFADSAVLRPSRTWVSATPYLRTRHVKRGDLADATFEMVRAECAHRNWPTPDVELGRARQDGAQPGQEIVVGGQPRNTLSFHRFRSRRGLTQPDHTGVALALTFPQPVTGPVALGFGCHFGLGLFRAADP